MARFSSARARTARNSVLVALGLVLFKAVVYFLTESSGVLGSAVDSLLDSAASLVVLWAILAAERPADADHPWGHGKAEGLASLFQSIFILVSGVGLLYHTVQRFFDEEDLVHDQGVGIVAMVVSIAVTVAWVRHLRKVAEESGSPALAADSAHYSSDVLLNASVIAGLGLSTLLGGAKWPDLVVGVGIGLLILNTARGVFFHATENLMDRGLEPGEAAAVLRTVAQHSPRVAGFHDLRSRRSGAEVFLELHLDLDRGMSFVEAHHLSEEVGREIEKLVPRSRVTIHADPL